jgi:hypothetical protein
MSIENGYQAPKLIDNPSDAEKKEHESKKDKAYYREASCAAINFYDIEGKRLKKIRFACMPEAGKGRVKGMIQ